MATDKYYNYYYPDLILIHEFSRTLQNVEFEFEVLEANFKHSSAHNFKHSSGRSPKTFCELLPRIQLCIDQIERYFVLPHEHVGILGDMNMGVRETCLHLAMMF